MASEPIGEEPSSEKVPCPPNLMSQGVRSTLAGLWGELLVEDHLKQRGWDVTLHGGYGKSKDLTAHHPKGLKVIAQVKATTKKLGFINWGKPGVEQVEALIDQAAREHARAILVLLHLGLPSARRKDDVLILSRPPILNITACTAEAWGLAVDAARSEYGSRRRQRGPQKGELLPESGCLHPCCVADFEGLDVFLSKIV